MSTHTIRTDAKEEIVIRQYQDGDVFLGETRADTIWRFVPRFLRPRRLADATIRTAPICEPWGSYIFDVFSHEDLLLSQDEIYFNLVALAKDKIVGVCISEPRAQTVLALCVHPEYRKYNLGSTLLERMLDDMYHEIGPLEIRLTSSPEAVKFYKRHGFVCTQKNTGEGEFVDMVKRPETVGPSLPVKAKL